MDFLDNRLLGATFYFDGKRAPIFPDSGYLVVRESMDFFLTTAEILFRDYKSSFVSNYPFVQNTELGILLQDDKNVKNIVLYPFNEQINQDDSLTESFKFSMSFISKYANGIITDSEFHSKRCLASDYVKYLADRLKLIPDIEGSKDIKVWINPNWKISQMLRYLAVHSVSVNNSSGYMYYITYDGKLVFKTVDKFFDLGGEGEKISISYKYDNIIGLIINKKDFSSVCMGVNNSNFYYYDLSTSSNVFRKVSYNDFVKKRALNSGVGNSLLNKGNTHFMGFKYSDDEYPFDFEKQVFNKSIIYIEGNRIILTIKDNPFGRKLGDIVNLTIPAVEGIDVNLNFSGRYIIKSIITKGNLEYFNTLELVRPGINLVGRENVL